MRDELRGQHLKTRRSAWLILSTTKCTVPIGCAQAGSTIDTLELVKTAKRYTGSPATQEDPYDFTEGEIPIPGIIDAGHKMVQMRCRTRWGSRTNRGSGCLKRPRRRFRRKLKLPRAPRTSIAPIIRICLTLPRTRGT